jgi:hypothetical protein
LFALTTLIRHLFWCVFDILGFSAEASVQVF